MESVGWWNKPNVALVLSIFLLLGLHMNLRESVFVLIRMLSNIPPVFVYIDDLHHTSPSAFLNSASLSPFRPSTPVRHHSF